MQMLFAVAASVVQYVAFHALDAVGGGNWALGFLFASLIGIGLGAINAALLAASILANGDAKIRAAVDAYRAAQTDKVLAQPDPRHPTIAT